MADNYSTPLIIESGDSASNEILTDGRSGLTLCAKNWPSGTGLFLAGKTEPGCTANAPIYNIGSDGIPVAAAIDADDMDTVVDVAGLLTFGPEVMLNIFSFTVNAGEPGSTSNVSADVELTYRMVAVV